MTADLSGYPHKSLGLWLSFCCLCVLFVPSQCDTPANCTYADIEGTWHFSIGPGNKDRNIRCSKFSGTAKWNMKVTLLYPDIAVDEYNNEGFWTLIYNQGFEVNVGGRKYFAFSKYVENISYCDRTFPGWSHNVLGTDWACFTANKVSNVAPKMSMDNSLKFKPRKHLINSAEMVNAINKLQTSWKAFRYPRFDHLSEESLVRMAGGKVSRFSSPKTVPVTYEHKKYMVSLPSNFDWRNVDGVNYVSPVRDQGECGSCYAFASMALNEARVRILTNNTQTPVFSPQDIVDCSHYSQACEGGFPYLVGGKYAEDYGLVEEKCNPYKGVEGKCSTDPKCKRHYATDYRYIGGYYGGCNEPLMMQALYERGPIAVSFEVYSDLYNYKSGVYHHVFDALPGFNPFELTNHVVLVVGWGTDKSSEQKYWIVKNSWGTDWGMDGYFWIRRGSDECAIESIAVESNPVFVYGH